MIGDVLELPSHDFGALELNVGALYEPIDRLGGFGAVILDFPGSLLHAVHFDEPYRGSQCAARASTQADTARQALPP